MVPRAAKWLVERAAPTDRVADILGDLEEAHQERLQRHGVFVATFLTTIEALDVARAARRLDRPAGGRSTPFSLLDFRLAARMLLRYPGLTVVAGFSMAFAIWVGATAFQFVELVLYPQLPLDEGDRVVGIVSSDTRLTHEYLEWNEGLESLVDLTAFASIERNVVVDETNGFPLGLSLMTAEGFELARVPPALGRYLVEDDERIGAPSVVVLAHDVWRDRFGSDSDIVGRVLRVAGEPTTVVGVMPEGFSFPLNYQGWMPLRLDRTAFARGEGPGFRVIARLAPDATRGSATAELATYVAAAASEPGQSERRLRAEVTTFVRTIINFPDVQVLMLMGWNLFPFLLLLAICSNVALLLFARAATREGELALRSALGASRRRIVGQLFVEALVLGGVAAAIGLAGTGVGVNWMISMVSAELEFLDGRMPFWVSNNLSATTTFYAVSLTLIGAAIAGVAPALRATRGEGMRLTQTAAGGGMQFSGFWTAVIVGQVAFSLTLPTIGFYVARDAWQIRNYEVGFPQSEYLGVEVRLDRRVENEDGTVETLAAFGARYGHLFDRLRARVDEYPEVTATTYARRLPRTYHPNRRVEIEGSVPIEDPRGHIVGRADVDPDYLEVLGQSVSTGRGFRAADAEADIPVVVVDQAFVERVLGGADPVGRQLHYPRVEDVGEVDPSEIQRYDVVGVIPGVGVRSGWGLGGVYHPADPEDDYAMSLLIRVAGDPMSIAPRLIATTTLLDPELRLGPMVPLDQTTARGDEAFYNFWASVVFLVSGVTLLLSLAGVYAVFSFTVARRTREIGVRTALGGRPSRILGSVLKRPIKQVCAGIGAGVLLTFSLSGAIEGGFQPLELAAIVAYGGVALCVVSSAVVVPTRRALRIQPKEALAADG